MASVATLAVSSELCTTVESSAAPSDARCLSGPMTLPTRIWWSWRESNPRPALLDSGSSTTETRSYPGSYPKAIKKPLRRGAGRSGCDEQPESGGLTSTRGCGLGGPPACVAAGFVLLSGLSVCWHRETRRAHSLRTLSSRQAHRPTEVVGVCDGGASAGRATTVGPLPVAGYPKVEGRSAGSTADHLPGRDMRAEPRK